MADTLEQKVKKIIGEQLGMSPDTIKLEDKFVEELGADSLDVVELIMAMEESFDVEISDQDAEKIGTVAQLVTYLQERNKG